MSEFMDSKFGSTRSLFRTDTTLSGRGLGPKASEPRGGISTSVGAENVGRLRTISRVTWGSVFRGFRTSPDPPSIMVEFQQKLHINSDTVVALLELAIILLSCVQLELSSGSPRWRENKVCARLPHCVQMEDEGSFAVPNCLRGAIGLLGLIRLWVRIRFLLKQRNASVTGISWFRRTTGRLFILEVLAIAIFPYPGLESVINRNQADVMVFLSIAVGVRSICWRHIMYFPFPIRQKGKIASFSGNLEFSYREFVFKKVMDDHPIRKIILISTILFFFSTFLVRAIETINCICAPHPAFSSSVQIDAHHLICVAMSWGDATWLVSTSFVMLGFGDVVPRSKAARSIIAVSSCVMRCLAAMLASVVIKKANFSTMEARVHAFLYRMDLFNKKDLSAVMAVQASFRFNKSYRRSLMWHRHQNSLLYYRPLSARLPNEVKKKLYVSRFQASLKEIMKFNTDGDPVNAFTKHIEVITAALGITLVEMAQLKKVYWRKSRLIDEKEKVAHHDSAQESHPDMGKDKELVEPTFSPPSPQCGSVMQSYTPSSSGQATSPNVNAEWGYSMLLRCQQVLAELQDIEKKAKCLGQHDRTPSVVREAVEKAD